MLNLEILPLITFYRRMNCSLFITKISNKNGKIKQVTCPKRDVYKNGLPKAKIYYEGVGLKNGEAYLKAQQLANTLGFTVEAVTFTFNVLQHKFQVVDKQFYTPEKEITEFDEI